MLKLLLILIALVSGLPASADIFSDSPSCYKPSKPFEFRDEFHYQQFMDEVESYRRCINDFVEEQREQAKSHLDAADDAISEWNRFVAFELD